MKSRLPQALGGDRETLKELEGLTMDSYLSQITAARRLGSLSGSAFGAKASDAQTQGFFRNTELGYAVTQDAAGLIERFIDRDLMSRPDQ